MTLILTATVLAASISYRCLWRESSVGSQLTVERGFQTALAISFVYVLLSELNHVFIKALLLAIS